MKTGAETVW